MNKSYLESARQTPVVEAVDVVVAGAGPAGVAAAIAAARQGASVRLIEAHGQLGGVWTTGLLSWVLDVQNKGGILDELFERLDARGARGPLGEDVKGVPYDVEQMKLALEQVCVEAGVRVRLHTRVAAAGRNSDGRLAVVVTESKSGREAFAAKVFIDCTGDGDLGALAGCGFDVGRPEDDPDGEPGEVQPMTLMALVGGVRFAETNALGLIRGGGITSRQAKNNLAAYLHELGVEPSYGDPTFFRIRDDLFAMMANHEYGRSSLSAQDLTDATLAARVEVNDIVDALRGGGGAFADIRLIATAAQIGVREGRRLHGRYVVSLEDMLEGRRHEDAVCRVTFGIDVHSTKGSRTRGVERPRERGKTRPYDIPLRALIAADIDGLMMAGRCISGDFLAHASYRVTGDSVALGEAAGAVAAIAAKLDRLPQDLDWRRDIRPRFTPAIRETATV